MWHCRGSVRRPASLSWCEEAVQPLRGLVRKLLGEEMPRQDRVATDVVRPAAPQPQRPARLGVPAAERPAGAPQHQQRAGDPPAGPPVLGVMLAVQVGRGPVLLSNTGGPEPPQRAKMLVRLVWILTVSNALKIIPAEVIRRNPLTFNQPLG